MAIRVFAPLERLNLSLQRAFQIVSVVQAVKIIVEEMSAIPNDCDFQSLFGIVSKLTIYGLEPLVRPRKRSLQLDSLVLLQLLLQ